MVTAGCVGSASLVAMGFDSINEQLNLIKVAKPLNLIKEAKPISIIRLRVAPVALGFSCSLISWEGRRRGFNTHRSVPGHSISLLGEDLKTRFVLIIFFFCILKNRKVL